MIKDKILHKTENIVYMILSVVAILFILYEIINLLVVFYNNIIVLEFSSERKQGFLIVPIFFNILIALEILETFKDHHMAILSRVKVIILITLTALLRKIITMDIKHTDYLLLLSIAVLIITLCFGYFLLSKEKGLTKKTY